MKRYAIWIEGYRASGDISEASLMGYSKGDSFYEAVSNFVKNLPKHEKYYWSDKDQQWSYWGCKAFDNEVDARESFG